jgi:hypothetical protein
MCTYDPGDDLARRFRHTGESRYPSPPSAWMPACAGMTNQGKNQVLAEAAISYSVDEHKLMNTSWWKKILNDALKTQTI